MVLNNALMALTSPPPPPVRPMFDGPGPVGAALVPVVGPGDHGGFEVPPHLRVPAQQLLLGAGSHEPANVGRAHAARFLAEGPIVGQHHVGPHVPEVHPADGSPDFLPVSEEHVDLALQDRPATVPP